MKPLLDKTLSLIGMPGVGKSTVGVLLAKRLGLGFVDSDLEIQRRQNATLQHILERDGYRRLREIEEAVLLELPLKGFVVSTGGSVVYSGRVMDRLAHAGPVVYLRASCTLLEARVTASAPRGIASDPQQSFAALYAERTPLYERSASFRVDTDGLAPEGVVAAIERLLEVSPT